MNEAEAEAESEADMELIFFPFGFHVLVLLWWYRQACLIHASQRSQMKQQSPRHRIEFYQLSGAKRSRCHTLCVCQRLLGWVRSEKFDFSREKSEARSLVGVKGYVYVIRINSLFTHRRPSHTQSRITRRQKSIILLILSQSSFVKGQRENVLSAWPRNGVCLAARRGAITKDSRIPLEIESNMQSVIVYCQR